MTNYNEHLSDEKGVWVKSDDLFKESECSTEENGQRRNGGNVHFSSNTDLWATPQFIYDRLDDEFGFTLDPCSDGLNNKCAKFYTKDDDGLAQDWSGETVFMNPPYGRAIKEWVRKAYEEGVKGGTIVVALIPSRTDTKYWHEYVMKAKEIRLYKGRLKFGDSVNSAPFPSALVVFDGTHDYPTLTVAESKEAKQ